MSESDNYSVQLVEDDIFAVVKSGKVVLTPGGNAIRTKSREVAEEVARDLNQHGPDPSASVSMYSSACSLFDFGLGADPNELAYGALMRLRDDPVLKESADPHIMFVQWAASRQPYFADNHVNERSPDDLLRWAATEMSSMSLHEIMAVVMVSAHTDSPLLGLALAKDQLDIRAAAPAFCGEFWAKKADELGGIWLGGFPQFWPNNSEESDCYESCVINSENGDLEHCCVASAFDVWRRFAERGRNE